MAGSEDGGRAARLEAALRANLRRRKAQAKARDGAATEAEQEPPDQNASSQTPAGERRRDQDGEA